MIEKVPMLKQKTGFTIVELLIVVVVIAILATITIIAYRGITDRAREASLMSDLNGAADVIKVGLLKNPTPPNSFPADVKASAGNVLSLTDHYGYEDGYCINGYSQSIKKYYSIREEGGLQEGLCPSETTGAARGGTFPSPVFGANVVSRVGDWKVTTGTGVSVSADKKELQLTPNVTGSIRSPLIYTSGSTSVTVKLKSLATQTSSQYAAQSQSGVNTGSTYYASDGETTVNNSSGYKSNGNAVATPLNQWHNYSYTYPTGSLVRYVRINVLSSTYTSNNQIKDVEIIVNN